MGQHHVVSKTDLHALSIVTHAHRVTHVMVAHLVASKIVRPELLTETHVQRATHATHVTRTSLVQPVLSAAQPLLGTRAQTHADHANLMTAHASSTATTATTAPTVVQTALTA